MKKPSTCQWTIGTSVNRICQEAFLPFMFDFFPFNKMDNTEFEPLIGYENEYEILNQPPYTIRKKDSHVWITEGDYRKNGKNYVVLNRRKVQKNKLLQKQFGDLVQIQPEPDSENKRFLPETWPKIQTYQGHEFENYYFRPENNTVWYDDGKKVKPLTIYQKASGMKYFKMFDKQKVRRSVSHAIIVKEYGKQNG